MGLLTICLILHFLVLSSLDCSQEQVGNTSKDASISPSTVYPTVETKQDNNRPLQSPATNLAHELVRRIGRYWRHVHNRTFSASLPLTCSVKGSGPSRLAYVHFPVAWRWQHSDWFWFGPSGIWAPGPLLHRSGGMGFIYLKSLSSNNLDEVSYASFDMA